MSERCSRVEVRRDDVRSLRVVDAPLPEPGDGEVLLRVDRFGLSSNNVSYAVSGDALKYWDYFPTDDAAWGCVPTWGFADVIASKCDEFQPGERVYGYLPMASHLLVRPGKIGPFQFLDLQSHRPTHASLYNQYQRLAGNPLFDPAREDTHMILFPLFGTSFLLADFVEQNEAFGAGTVVLGSASSKTAVGLAWLLSRREGLRVVGLTSAANRGFVEALGYYDEVASYDDLSSVATEPAAMYIDMSGNAQLTRAVHQHWGERLLHSAAVGATHWDARTPQHDASAVAGVRPKFFFAPNQAMDFARREGAAELWSRIARSTQEFMAVADKWLKIEKCQGSAGVAAAWERMLENRLAADTGIAVRMAQADTG